MTDSAVWPAVRPTLRAALVAPQPACALALALLRRLVAAAREASAGPQLASLATILAASLQAQAASESELSIVAVVEALAEAEAALHSCWQARAC
jgi:hypothetical protein